MLYLSSYSNANAFTVNFGLVISGRKLMKVTYLGTTTLLFDDGRDQVLFDCHVTRPSLWKCTCAGLRTDTAVADRVINEFEINRLKAVFISHSHYDHVMDAPYFARKCSAEIYGSPSTVNVALGGEISPENIHSYRDSMNFRVGDYEITVIPSVHSVAHWYNNDLEQTIDAPLSQPAVRKEYKEGGSFDFLIRHSGKTYLIRPSYNFLENQLDGISADVLFLGIGGLYRDKEERKRKFYSETIEKVNPHTVIPVHWDNFMTPLYDKRRWMTGIVSSPQNSINELKQYCQQNNISFILQMPLSGLEV